MDSDPSDIVVLSCMTYQVALAPNCHACPRVTDKHILSSSHPRTYNTVKRLKFLKPKMSTLSAISSNLVKRTIPFCSFSSSTVKAPPLLLSYNPIFRKHPMRLSARLLANEAGRSPPEFPPEVPQVPFTPEIDPSSTPAEVHTNPPPYTTPGPKPGPEFPRPPIPPQPDPVPELPEPIIPPRPDPDIPHPKPDVVPPGPDIVPPPSTPPQDISPPTGPYVV
ncbi:pollen-specific leucine-rich repeat extensin-like protein 3 [Corylus avellana]|uniref:pollen-specific leucine-rich repeat extensin-like protein 3 n=1 Tax=Corylus avellana TaxID=13451 RepID=UPI00286C513E|nr:pollen-specific leucine-rich repeat extensin-like protein 3 [Corylus avellana]